MISAYKLYELGLPYSQIEETKRTVAFLGQVVLSGFQ